MITKSFMLLYTKLLQPEYMCLVKVGGCNTAEISTMKPMMYFPHIYPKLSLEYAFVAETGKSGTPLESLSP